METQRILGHPILIIGAGRGGSALLEMFLDDSLVDVLAIADTDPDAPGMRLARNSNIPTYTDVVQALRACKEHQDCIVFNLSHDDGIAEEVDRVFPGKRLASGLEVKLFWQMVTNLKQVKGELETSQRQLQSIIHNVMDGIITINEAGAIQGFNPAAEEIFGYSLQEVLGNSLNMLMPEPDRSQHDGHIKRYVQTGQARILGVRGREVLAMRKSGERFPMEVSVSEMMLGGLRYFIGIVRDITERKRTEEKIAHLAHYDYLTDLPNRALFLEGLGQYISLAKRNDYKLAVLFLDLDGFKKVNDTLGHDAGDLLLQGVARRLKEVIRASDTVARVGGDEFVFVLNDIKSEESAAALAQKVISALSAPFELAGRSSHVGGSVGISIYPDDADQAEALVKQADEAMYLAKKSGRNNYKLSREVAREPGGA